jgi:hypothetical protein
LTYAGHTDNDTDNIRACPEKFPVVGLRGKRRLLLGALANQGFESPCLQSLKGAEAKSTLGHSFGCTSGSVIPGLQPRKLSGLSRRSLWQRRTIHFRFAICDCRFK